MVKKIYIKVTDDELRLPVAIADSAKELARQVGTTTNTIYASICHAKHGRRKSIYECVEIEEEDEP
jgi:hypothetical protein